MLKIFFGFILFAALALFVIFQGTSSLRGLDPLNAPSEAVPGDAASAATDASAAK